MNLKQLQASALIFVAVLSVSFVYALSIMIELFVRGY